MSASPKRLWAAARTDMILQSRNRLYAISVFVSALTGLALAQLSSAETMASLFPAAALLIAGGSTLLYVTAMIALERGDGTLQAVSVSPLQPSEYIGAKVLTLTALGALEATLMFGAAWALMTSSYGATLHAPSLGALSLGAISLAAMHVLAGVIVAVRFREFIDALLPMGGVAVVMQLPAFYFLGALPYEALLVIPSGAPTMLLYGAFHPLKTWQWVYAVVGSALTLAALWRWALIAFEVHVTQKMG